MLRVGTRNFYPKIQFAHIRVKMWKCIFVRLIYSISFLTAKSAATLLCPCPPRNFQLSASVLSGLLQGYCKSFLGAKTHYKYKSSISWFLRYCRRPRKSLSCRMDWNSLYCSKICITITIVYPKAKTFQELFNLSSPHITSATLCKPLFSLFRYLLTSHDLSFSDSNFISFRPFIIHLNFFTHFLFLASNASIQATSPSLIFPCPFFSKRLQLKAL